MLEKLLLVFPGPLMKCIVCFCLLTGVAYVVNIITLLLLQRYLVAKAYVPFNFRAGAHFKKSLFFLLISLGAKLTTYFIFLDTAFRNRAMDILNIALILSFTWFLARILGLVKLSMYLHLDITSRADNLRQRKIRTQVQFLEKLILVFLYVIAVSMILMSFDNVRRFGSSLIASAGLAGVIVGLAAQKSLTNLISGFQIAFTQPIRNDDVVIVENEWGRIEEITFTDVVIRLWDKRSLVVPITYFLEKPFQNWTRASADLVATVMIYVDFNAPLDELRAEFYRIINNCSLWDGKVSAVQVTNMTPSEMEVRFLVGARNASEAFDLRCILREKLIAFLQKQNVDFYPQRRLQMSGDDPFSIRLRDKSAAAG